MPKRFVEGLVLEADSIDEAEERAILIQCSSKAASSTRPQSFSERTSTLFHAELVDREFGSALLHVPALLAWVKSKGMHLQTEPPIDGFEFVQAEALLCAIERPFQALTREQAGDIVASNPTLNSHRAALSAPSWLLGANAHATWRKVLEKAAQNGELVLLEFATKMPTSQAATLAPVADSASNSATPDPERRLACLRALGGNATYKRGEWKIIGISALVASEKSEGRKRSDEKTIRADLKEAAENEREAKRANAFSGLGQR